VRCTEGFLSKVENNKARLSLATLHRLVTALEINVASLFVEKSAPDDLVLLTRSGAFHDQDGHTSSRAGGNARAAGIKLGVPPAAGQHPSCCGSSDGLIRHEGEEMGYVLEGALELDVNAVKVAVATGDTFFFDSSLPRGYRNTGTVAAKVQWDNTPELLAVPRLCTLYRRTHCCCIALRRR